jgi:D-alanyl-D-alanine dipeptidase
MLDDPKYHGPGDVIVSQCNVIATNGKHLTEFGPKAWNTITLVESLGLEVGDTQFIDGEIVIVDAINVYNEMRFHGDELVILHFKTPQKKEIVFFGRVYEIDLSDFEQKRMLTLKFCSGEKLTSDSTKIHKTYRNVDIKTIANDLYAPLLAVSKKTIQIEATKNQGSVSFANKTPLDALNMMARVARSDKYKGASYIFNEHLDGYFRFMSIEHIVNPANRDPVMVYKYDAPKSGTTLKDVGGMSRIQSFKILKTPNLINNIHAGLYASTVVTNDLLKRQHTMDIFDYEDSYNDYKHVNFNEVSGKKTLLTNSKIFSKRRAGHYRFVPTNFKSFDTDRNFTDERADTVLERASQLEQINQIKVEITIPGDSQRHTGEIVEINLPAVEVKTGADAARLDRNFSGRYLVSKIKHIIFNGNYTSILQLSRDSWPNPLPERVI